MWDSHVDILEGGRVQKYRVVLDEQPVAFAEIISLWRGDASFRSWFNTLLGQSPFRAFRWETPPITSACAERDFEFVLHRSDGLEGRIDERAFADYFLDDGRVVTFANLGRDAVLVVPCPVGDVSIYGHLASFVRQAPDAQIQDFWIAVGNAMHDRVGESPVWLSTAGYGVSWLHVRLDDRPKYYGYAPYKSAP
jgi:hypothetical protein